MKINTSLTIWGLVVFCFPFVACSSDGTKEEPVSSVRSDLTACVFGAPIVTQTLEQNPGAVAPGISKVYFVTLQNTNSVGCSPATLSFVPDSFHFFSVVAQPNSVGGVASGATAQFRVTVTSDPSVAVGTYSIGFTGISNTGGSVRGALTYQVTLDNPTGCNRQPLAIAIDNPRPPAVPAGTAVNYQVTARNVDNLECGADLFFLSLAELHLGTAAVTGPFTIAPQSSAAFQITISAPVSVDENFVVAGQRHGGALSVNSTVHYTVQ